MNLGVDSESSCHEAMLIQTGTGFPEALDSPGMCTLLLPSTFPLTRSQLPSVSPSRSAGQQHKPLSLPSLPQLQPQTATCQQQKEHLPKSSVQVVSTRKIPGKIPTTPAASNSSQLEQKFNIPPTLLPSRSSHQVQQSHFDTWHRERLAASSLPSRTLLPATLQRITANCSKELPAQAPATKQTSLSTAILSPGRKPTSPSWHHQLTKWNKDTQGRLCI